MTRTTRRTLLQWAAACLSPGAAPVAFAQADSGFTKSVHFLVPYSPGGSTSFVARLVGEKVAEMVKQAVLIENRPGAGGGLAMETLARSSADGYTIAMGHTGTQAINPHIYGKLGYDPRKDFANITPLVSYVNVLVVHPAVPAKTVAELVAWAKGKPGGATYASGGNGATNHLSGELFRLIAGVPLVLVMLERRGVPHGFAALEGR